jgi:transposase-like protein
MWERMRSWLSGGPPAAPDGSAALEALSDVGSLRRLLDEVELTAVRTARRAGRSWSEIATRLGVTRQSAWERWRDLDEAPPSEARPPEAMSTIEPETLELVRASVAEHLIDPVAKRRRSTVTVPKVVGRPLDEAVRALAERGLLAIGPDPDGPPLGTHARPGALITDQAPEAGSKVPERSWVRLWHSGGGPGGVREPRNPPPGPKTLRAALDVPDRPAD